MIVTPQVAGFRVQDLLLVALRCSYLLGCNYEGVLTLWSAIFIRLPVNHGTVNLSSKIIFSIIQKQYRFNFSIIPVKAPLSAACAFVP